METLFAPFVVTGQLESTMGPHRVTDVKVFSGGRSERSKAINAGVTFFFRSFLIIMNISFSKLYYVTLILIQVMLHFLYLFDLSQESFNTS